MSDSTEYRIVIVIRTILTIIMMKTNSNSSKTTSIVQGSIPVFAIKNMVGGSPGGSTTCHDLLGVSTEARTLRLLGGEGFGFRV